jgi:hypothetical protein
VSLEGSGNEIKEAWPAVNWYRTSKKPVKMGNLVFAIIRNRAANLMRKIDLSYLALI